MVCAKGLAPRLGVHGVGANERPLVSRSSSLRVRAYELRAMEELWDYCYLEIKNGPFVAGLLLRIQVEVWMRDMDEM